jgi:hypothetical protein
MGLISSGKGCKKKVKIEWGHTELDAGSGPVSADTFRAGVNFPVAPMDQLR